LVIYQIFKEGIGNKIKKIEKNIYNNILYINMNITENEYIKTFVDYNKIKLADSALAAGNKQYLVDQIDIIYNDYVSNTLSYTDTISKINNIVKLFI